MHYVWKGAALLIFHNFQDQNHEVVLHLKLKKATKLIDLMKEDQISPDGKSRYKISLDPYGYRWFRLNDLGHTLQREKV
jgi:maltose alpha-D-glucosyltransferase/alpha-amylase